MKPQIVVALYKPHSGKEAELKALLKGHLPALRKAGLATNRPEFFLQSTDGTLIEIFEWVSAEAAKAAHSNPEVGKIWEAASRIAEFPAMEQLPEAKQRFSHFTHAV